MMAAYIIAMILYLYTNKHDIRQDFFAGKIKILFLKAG
jgi:hypothetical protein